MRVKVSGSDVTAWGDSEIGAPYVEFDCNLPPGVVDPDGKGWTISGDAPARELLDPNGNSVGQEIAAGDSPHAFRDLWVVDSEDIRRGHLYWDADDGQLRLDSLDADGSTVVSQAILGHAATLHAPASGSVDLDLELNGHATLYLTDGSRGTRFALHSGAIDGAGSEFDLVYGALDPSVDPGLALPGGALLSRDVDGHGLTFELWFKTGAGDTDWTNLTP